MSSSPQPQAGTANELRLQSGAGSTIDYETDNQPPHAADPEESSAPPLEGSAEFEIYSDTESHLPRTADNGQSSVPLNVLQELPVPPPPYERRVEPAGGTDAMEIVDQLQHYQRIASALRETLAGRSSIFTETEIDLACGYMCSTTRGNLTTARFETAEQGAHVFAQYNQALDLFQTAVNGAHIQWEHMFLDDEVTPHITAAAAIDFLLVTRILLPRMQELVILTNELAST